MLLVMLTLLGVILTGDVDSEAESRRCDDGEEPFTVTGEPNWVCEIDGCSPLEANCWEYRNRHCYDEFGEENGTCELERKTCQSKFSCFELWVGCAGYYKCTEAGTLGCNEGYCIEATVVAPSDDASASQGDSGLVLMCKSEQAPGTVPRDGTESLISTEEARDWTQDPPQRRLVKPVASL